MEGRWALKRRNGGVDATDALLDDTAARDDWIPVVPCDDAAIERAEHVAARWLGRGDQVDDDVQEMVLNMFRAAGETP